MAIVGVRILALTIFVISATLMFDNNGVSAEQDCDKVDISALDFRCSRFFHKLLPKVVPSPECCSVAKSIGVTCACKFVTKEVEDEIDMEKAIYVFRTCGLNVPKGMQCGSYKVPNARKEITA